MEPGIEHSAKCNHSNFFPFMLNNLHVIAFDSIFTLFHGWCSFGESYKNISLANIHQVYKQPPFRSS